MFGNALFHPQTQQTPGRRHSHLDVSLAPKLSQRRATSPVINVDCMSPGLGYMNGPSTPCFVTPTLGGFSGRRFSYDSPLQTIIGSGGLPTLNRKAAKRAWANVKNTKKWSRPCKMVMIMLLASLAVTLFLVRKSRESAVPVQVRMNPPPCNDHTGTCDAPGVHKHPNNLKEEFMGMVTEAEHFHEIEEEKDLWVNRWSGQEATIEEAPESESTKESEDLELNVVEQEPLEYEDLSSKVMDYVDSVKSFIGEQMKSESQDEAELDNDASAVQDAPLEVSSVEASGITPSHVHVRNGVTSWHENDHTHANPNVDAWPMQGFTQVPKAKPQQPSVPQQPVGHMQAPGGPQHLYPHGQAPVPQQPAGHMRAPGVPSHHLHGQAPVPQQYPTQGMPQQPAGHLRPPAPQVIGVPAQMANQYAHPMPNHPLPPGVNPHRYNQYPQPPQHHHNQGIIGHNPPHHQNFGQRLPPGVNPHHYGL